MLRKFASGVMRCVQFFIVPVLHLLETLGKLTVCNELCLAFVITCSVQRKLTVDRSI